METNIPKLVVGDRDRENLPRMTIKPVPFVGNLSWFHAGHGLKFARWENRVALALFPDVGDGPPTWGVLIDAETWASLVASLYQPTKKGPMITDECELTVAISHQGHTYTRHWKASHYDNLEVDAGELAHDIQVRIAQLHGEQPKPYEASRMLPEDTLRVEALVLPRAAADNYHVLGGGQAPRPAVGPN